MGGATNSEASERNESRTPKLRTVGSSPSRPDMLQSVAEAGRAEEIQQIKLRHPRIAQVKKEISSKTQLTTAVVFPKMPTRVVNCGRLRR